MTISSHPIISLQNVSYIRNEQALLKNISWQISEKENWALLGPNGSGKTTLMKMIAGWLFPSQGNLDVLGHHFGESNLTELRSRIGWVTGMLTEQVPQQLSAKEIIISGTMGTLGLFQTPTSEQVKYAESFIDLMEVNRFADRQFALLSQGERMRTLIARALATKPLLLILDEPCSGLDPVSQEKFLQTINHLTLKKDAPPILFVTHHIEEIIPGIQHVLALRQGEIIVQGAKEKVLTEENLKKIFQVNFQVSFFENRYYGRPCL